MNSLKSIIRNRLVQSLLFWAISFFVLLRIFAQTDDIRMIDVIYTGLFHLPMVFAVHFHDRFLFRRLMLNQRYTGYGIAFFFLLASTYFIYLFTFNKLSGWLFPDYYFVAVYSPSEIIGFTFIYLFAATTIDITRSWFSQQQDIARLAQLEEENKRAELKVLRAQVNPHFLFNSLNTIYSEALKKSDKAPKLILKLSDMLRYVVEKMNQNLVTLEEEIEYLKNFVELHKARLNDPSKVKFIISGDFSSLKIAPLLLLNFLENAFKHADLTDDDTFISIEISTRGKELRLSCSNSFFEDDSQQIKSSGSGIENAKRRLELVYPDRHSLHIRKNENTYHLKLKLELD